MILAFLVLFYASTSSANALPEVDYSKNIDLINVIGKEYSQGLKKNALKKTLKRTRYSRRYAKKRRAGKRVSYDVIYIDNCQNRYKRGGVPGHLSASVFNRRVHNCFDSAADVYSRRKPLRTTPEFLGLGLGLDLGLDPLNVNPRNEGVLLHSLDPFNSYINSYTYKEQLDYFNRIPVIGSAE